MTLYWVRTVSPSALSWTGLSHGLVGTWHYGALCPWGVLVAMSILGFASVVEHWWDRGRVPASILSLCMFQIPLPPSPHPPKPFLC